MAKHTPFKLDAQAVHVKALSKQLSAHSAEYIVRACESHEDLVTACKEAQSVYDYLILQTPTGSEREELTEQNILRMQAIKQARSKS